MKDIKTLCRERGRTMRSVAEPLGMTPQNMGKLMRGNPTLSLLRRVAKELGIRLKELFEDE